MGELIRLDPRRAPRTQVVIDAIDVQARAHELRVEGARMWKAARRSHDWALLAEVKALADTLRAADVQARRIAGIADGIEECPLGLWSPKSGHAA